MRAAACALSLLALAVALAGCLNTPGTTPTPPGGPGSPGAPGALVRVTTANGPASETTVAINPKDPLNMIGGAKDFTLGEKPGPGCPKYNVWSGVYWTKDGGATWKNALMPGFPGDKNQTLLSHYQCNSDPVVAFGIDGAAYYSGLAYGGNASATGLCPDDQAAPLCAGSVWVAKSTDGGDTWKQFVNVALSDGGQIGLDKQWFATDPTNANNLALTWIQFSAAAAYFLIAASSDGGATWTPPVTLAELDAPVHQFAMPQYGPDGTLYVIWHNFGAANNGPLPVGIPAPLPSTPLGAPGSPQVMFTKNVPNTPGFLPAHGIAPVNDIKSPLANGKFRTTSIPALAVDTTKGPNAGHLYVVWADQQGDNSDILLVSSADGGTTWTAPVKVNQDATKADQFMTWVTVAEDGSVLVSFFDRSYDPANTKLDLTLARSTDAGKTWAQTRVTDRSWDVPEGCFHQQGFPFIGDYTGLVAAAGKAHPFFASGASGFCEVYSTSLPYASIGNATRAP